MDKVQRKVAKLHDETKLVEATKEQFRISEETAKQKMELSDLGDEYETVTTI